VHGPLKPALGRTNIEIIAVTNRMTIEELEEVAAVMTGFGYFKILDGYSELEP